MVHLNCPEFNVAGVALPGLPAVIIGHNQRIAWGVTNLHFDVQDLYVERLDAKTGRYVYQGQVLQAASERELIPVKGGHAFEFSNWVTRHGPLWTSNGTQLMTLRWTAADPDAFDFPFFLIAAAGDWTSFRDAVRRFPGPAQNFVYADIDGNIGYQVAGHLPVRRDYDGDLPVDGSSGKFEWDGYIPFDDLPSKFNPPEGMIVSANQNSFPADYKYRVHGSFGPDYRARQIRHMLAAHGGWKVPEMLSVEKDVYSAFSHYLAGETVKAWQAKGRRADLQDPVAVLGEWNGQMEKSMSAPFLISLVFDHLRRDIAERAVPGKGAQYERHVTSAAVEHLLGSRSNEWFGDWNAELLRALSQAVDDARSQQGGNPRNWQYGRYLELEIVHPVGGAIPVIGKYFNIGPVPMSGSSTTVKQTTRRLGPSERFVADFTDWDRSLLNVTIGESGHILSKHYSDQWPSYYVGHSFTLPFKTVTGDELRFVPERR